MERIMPLYFSYKKEFYLIIGTILSMFSLGLFNISILIFLWPFCLLHYINLEKNFLKSILLLFLSIFISNIIKWINSTNDGFIYDLLTAAYFSLITFIPFVLSKIFYTDNENNKIKNILLFPLFECSVEFIFSFIPLSNSAIFAYSQFDNILLAQSISLFGLYFLSFIIALFASLVENVFIANIKNINNKNNTNISCWLIFYVLLIIALHLFGGIVLQQDHNNNKITVVNCIGLSPLDYLSNDEHQRPISEYVEYIENKTIKAKKLNADLLTFGEESFYLHISDYENLIQKVINLSKNYSIYISIGLDVYTDNINENYNDNILISNTGERIYNYRKHHPLVFGESDYIKGKEDIKVIETNIGRITSVICYDINFDFFMNHIGGEHPDIVIVPSWDYEAVADFQTNIARFRSIENGFNLIKNTVDGISVSIDYQGGVINFYKSEGFDDYFVVSEVYKEGRKTLFSYIGRWFNYIYIVGTILLVTIKWEKINIHLRKKINSEDNNLGTEGLGSISNASEMMIQQKNN